VTEWDDELAAARERFFARTRGLAAALYVLFTAMTVGFGVLAAMHFSARVGLAFVAAFSACAALIAVGRMFPSSPRRSLIMILVAAPLGVVISHTGLFAHRWMYGAGAGLMAASTAGIVLGRRRLARDPEFFEAARRRGWDPDAPYGSLFRGATSERRRTSSPE
jgi:hypothetical protein